MKKSIVIAGSIIGSLLVIVVIAASMLWSQYKTTVSLEERVSAQYATNQSNYDNMWKRFMEITQVTELQAEQFKDVYTDLIAGRYEDQDLLFKFVTESNPQLGTEVYTQLQREISAGRQQFDNNQKKITDIIREYNTYIRQKIIIAAITGKKPLDINEYIITSDRTDDAFKAGKDDVIDLKGN